MSLKTRFFVLSLLFVAGTVTFYLIMENQKEELRSIRHRIEDDWEETRLLMELSDQISDIHMEFEGSGLEADREMAMSHLGEALARAAEIRDHAEDDPTGDEGEEQELTSLARLDQTLHDLQAFINTSPAPGTTEEDLLRQMNALYGRSMIAIGNYNQGALEELDSSLDRLDRSEEVLENMSHTWTIGMFVLLALAWVGFGIWLLRPIRRLQKMVRYVRNGKFESVSGARAPGEIGEVISSFQDMATEIHYFTTQLEHRVQERTQELESSRRQLRQMLDLLPDAVGLATPDGKIVMANDTYRTLLSPDGVSKVKELQQGKRTPQGYFQWVSPDGTSRMLDVQELPIATVDGQTDVVLECVRDMTRQLEVEAALASSQKLAALGRLSSGMAHEINNPLTAIGACAEGLLKRLKADQLERETFFDYLQTIHDEVFRCKEITERLLDLSRRREHELKDFQPCDLIEDVTRLVGKLAESKGVTIESCLGDDAEIHSSPSAFRQVILNLLMNSIEACDNGGRIEIEGAWSNGDVQISIQDNGVGIAPEDLDHLFEPFFTRRRDQNGTGLGLYVCQGLIDALGGKLRAESEGRGKGSRFIVTLPRHPRTLTEES
ncbi:HAMP domain-containing protein [bacterium]|nr:HAMP domain-containing protein [bacterium]